MTIYRRGIADEIEAQRELDLVRSGQNAAPSAGNAGSVMSMDSTLTIMSAPSRKTKIRDCGPIMKNAHGFSRLKVPLWWRQAKKAESS